MVNENSTLRCRPAATACFCSFAVNKLITKVAPQRSPASSNKSFVPYYQHCLDKGFVPFLRAKDSSTRRLDALVSVQFKNTPRRSPALKPVQFLSLLHAMTFDFNRIVMVRQEHEMSLKQ